MFSSIGGLEILVILVVALLVLGPDHLPRVMRTVGKAVGELRRVSTEFQRTVNTELALDGKQPQKITAKPEKESSEQAAVPVKSSAKDRRASGGRSERARTTWRA